jgi:hypothetical protein
MFKLSTDQSASPLDHTRASCPVIAIMTMIIMIIINIIIILLLLITIRISRCDVKPEGRTSTTRGDET